VVTSGPGAATDGTGGALLAGSSGFRALAGTRGFLAPVGSGDAHPTSGLSQIVRFLHPAGSHAQQDQRAAMPQPVRQDPTPLPVRWDFTGGTPTGILRRQAPQHYALLIG
jgi:hypothetical protein